MRKRIISVLLIGSTIFLMAGCGDHAGHNHAHEGEEIHHHDHEGHDHEDHDHDHEDHEHEGHHHEHEDHDHEGHHHEHEGHSHEGHDHEHEGESHAAGEIVLEPERAEAAGVKVEAVHPGPFHATIHTSGLILPASGSEAYLTARTSGILSFGGRTPAPGQQVAKGQSVARVSGGSMAEGDIVTRTRIEYQAALKEYERAKNLIEEKLISERDFNAIEAAYLTAKNSYEGVSAGSGASGVSVTSPIAGFIKEMLKSEGEFVSAGEPVGVVTQDRKLRLQADLPEKYMSLRTSISSANFRMADGDHSHTLEELDGKLISVAHALESDSPYLHITFEFNNCGDILPGAYAEVWLITGWKDNVISVPESALTEEQGEFFVYVRLDEDCYKKVPVKVGERNGENVEILSGLHEGDDLVVAGAYQVKLASASIVPHAHNHSH